MRLAVVIQNLEPARGGAEVYTADLVRWLLREGYGVTVLAAQWDARLEAELRALSGDPTEIRFERIDAGGGGDLRTLRFIRGVAARLAALRHSGEIDAAVDIGAGLGADVVIPPTGVYADGFEGNLDSVPGTLERTLRRAACAISPSAWLRRRLQALRFEREPRPHVVCFSRRIAASFARTHGLPASHLHVIPPGIDPAPYAPERLAALRGPARAELGLEQEVMVLTTARNYRLKGVASLLAVAPRLSAQRLPFAFVVVGGGAAVRRPFEEEAARRGGASIRFVEPAARIEPYYAAADVFLLPSFYDACSLAVMEAMAAGLPAITTRRNGAADLIEPGRTGFVFDHPRDIDALEGILVALADGKRRAAVGAAARAASARFAGETNFRSVLAVLETCRRGAEALQEAGAGARRRVRTPLATRGS